MPGLGLCLTQGLRLTQRLKLEQRLTLTMVQRIDTEDGKSARRTAALLRMILRDLDASVYTDVASFVERVGKRVPKVKRTEATRRIVEQLRESVTLLDIHDLAAVRTLVAWGYDVYRRWNVAPVDEYDTAIRIWKSRACPDAVSRLAVLEILCANVEDERSTLNLHDLLETCAEDQRFTVELFAALVTACRGAPARAVDLYRDDLREALPATVTVPQLQRALALLAAYDRYIGHLHAERHPRRFRASIERGASGRWPEIPDIVQMFLPDGTTDETRDCLAARFRESPLTDSTDAVRDLLRMCIVLSKDDHGAAYLSHALQYAGTAKMLVRIAREIGQAACYVGDRCISYPLSATNADEILKRIRNRDLDAVIAHLPMLPGYHERLIDSLTELPQRVVEIVLRLTQIYTNSAPDVLPVLARIVEAIVDRKFNAFRYEHDAAAAQLAPVRGDSAWRENVRTHRVLGSVDAGRAQLNAVNLLKAEAAAIFERSFGAPWNGSLAGHLEREIVRIEERLRDPALPSGDKREFGVEAKALRAKYHAARIVESFALELHMIEHTRGYWREAQSKPWMTPFRDLLERAVATLDEPALDKVRIVEVSESDDLLDLLQIGVLPTLTCQRWLEATSYNKCLLAYVADPNKKLWQLRKRGGEIIGRVVVRLLPFKRSALILIEPPYATHWSNDHTRAVLAEILRKAAKLATSLGKPVAIGYIGVLRWGEWGKAFEEIGKECDVKPKTTNFNPRLPESFNLYEYSDSLGGAQALERGHVFPHPARLTYVTVGHEDDDEPGTPEDEVFE